jgi:hypothetical protein
MLLARDGTKYCIASYITVYSGIREHYIFYTKYSELSERKLLYFIYSRLYTVQYEFGRIFNHLYELA